MSDVDAEALAATALAYRDSSAVVMHKHREQARAVLDALAAGRFAVVQLPEPVDKPQDFDDDRGVGIWCFGEYGRIAAWSDGYMVDEHGESIGGVEIAREWGLALIAAAAAAASLPTTNKGI